MGINQLFRDPGSFLYAMLLTLPGIIIGLTFHEYAHAYVSYRLGDPTPKNQGRVTISPFAHIDPLGFIMLLLFRFGYGKPVMINPNNYKDRRKGEILVSLAGVTMNFIVAVVCALIYYLLIKFQVLAFGSVIRIMLQYTIIININLMVFNLLPIPPLDGYKVVRNLLIGKIDVGKLWHFESFFNRYGFIILFILLYLPATQALIQALSGYVLDFVNLLTAWIL